MKFLLPFLLCYLCIATYDVAGQNQEFLIPSLAELPRIDRTSPRPAAEILKNSAFILKFREHRPNGDAYVILTDHQEKPYLESLQKLARHRAGSLIQTDDLALLYKDKDSFEAIRSQLITRGTHFLAIAPRLESYRENMLLGLWDMLTTLDPDPQLDVYPGILLASNAESFASLIDRSINHQPLEGKALQPLAVSQVRTTGETRSLQKAAILRNLFDSYGLKMPIVALYTPLAAEAPVLTGKNVWNIRTATPGEFVKKFSSGPSRSLQNASLVMMHGHGIPGMSCSMDIDAIPLESANRIVLCGSCFSAAPVKSDFPALSRAPGGYSVKQRQAFSSRYIDRGATVFFGHMRLSSGFPHLFPVLEKWTQGATVGEAYQQLLNAIIGMRGFRSGQFVATDITDTRRIPQNILLYVVLGDPAVVPIAQLRKPAP